MHEIETVVESYEDAQARGGRADIAEFLPDREHPQYVEIACELVRVDLEYSFERGQPKRLDDYRSVCCDLFDDRHCLEQAAFEEYRLRHRSGELVTPGEYRARYGIETDRWPLLSKSPAGAGEASDTGAAEPADGRSTGPAAAAPRAGHEQGFPEAPGRFLGFELLAELGRGAFARVYLAREAELANRRVALKITRRASAEPDRLAQLQHTNIVPIFSVHRDGSLQAICMPYFGSTTLADLLNHFRTRQGLPQSGAELLSTLQARHDATRAAHNGGKKGSGLFCAKHPSGRSGKRVLTPFSQEPVSGQWLRRLSYPDAAVWIADRIAAGLAHAHDRGIVHRDLKPANLLLANDGRPMILDFNLAAGQADTEDPTAGGTLPYMAPEQIEAFESGRQVDARSDIYALGIILFEMLCGRLPFPVHRGSWHEQAPLSVEDRNRGPASVRAVRPAVPRDIDAIVQKCLQPDPARRYASARALREDLRRHLNNLPLRHAPNRAPLERAAKWARRHPRLTSASSVASIAALVVATLVGLWFAQGRKIERLEAHTRLDQLVQAMPTLRVPLTSPDIIPASVAEAAAAGRAELDRLGIVWPLAPDWWQQQTRYKSLEARDQLRLRASLGELLYLLAGVPVRPAAPAVAAPARTEQLGEALRFIEVAQSMVDGPTVPRAFLVRKADVLAALGRADEASRVRARADRQAVTAVARDRYLLALDAMSKRQFERALPILQQTRAEIPSDFSIWFLTGNCHVGLGQLYEAEGCFTTCLALSPDSYWAFFHRGLCRLELKKYVAAADDFDGVLALRPGLAPALINRALAYAGQGNLPAATRDLTQAIAHGGPTRARFLRARYYRQLGHNDQAAADLAAGLQLEPTDEKSWIARGIARLRSDPEKAMADLRQALVLNPRSIRALQNIAFLLADKPNGTDQALGVMNQILAIRPEHTPALAGRGVLLARLGQRDEALRDATAVLRIGDDGKTLYHLACLYALTSRQNPPDRQKALQLLARALRDQTWRAPIARTDPDLETLRDDPQFASIVAAAETLGKVGTGPRQK